MEATMSQPFIQYIEGIDHVAIAVRDLNDALPWYTDVLGFVVIERRTTEGTSSGMLSAVIQNGPLHFVLLQGTNEQSQVSRYIEQYGPGVQHIALKVTNIEAAVDALKVAGMPFATSVIGNGALRQAFTGRDHDSGIMIELIERNTDGFTDSNVSELFRQLEAKDGF
jgi:methylmalonyl-CoA/ethylmalonyl-CoA epimerase